MGRYSTQSTLLIQCLFEIHRQLAGGIVTGDTVTEDTAASLQVICNTLILDTFEKTI